MAHSEVTRSLSRVGVLGPGPGETFERTAEIRLDPGWVRRNLRAVTFVQAAGLGAIRGVASARIADLVPGSGPPP